MDRHMNFEDNIFILNIRIRMIQDIVILDADPGLFLEKTLDDLGFIDNSLGFLFTGLIKNEKLLERNEQFFNLSESERIFCELLFEMSHGESGFSALMDQPILERLSAMRNHSLDRRRSIGEMIVESKSTNSEPVVSYDELHELLSS